MALTIATFRPASAAPPADPVAVVSGIRVETQLGVIGSAGIDDLSTSTSLPVNELDGVWGTPVAVPASFDIYVGEERMTVSGRSCSGTSCSYTVARGVLSTTRSTHAADAIVTRVWTTAPTLVNANRDFGVKVSADVAVTLTNGEVITATSGGSEWTDTTDKFLDGGCTDKVDPEVKTWTIVRTTFANPEVQVALEPDLLSSASWQDASSTYKFSVTKAADWLNEGSNAIAVVAKARADKTVTTFIVKEYRFRNGAGKPTCYPASNTSTAWSVVPESHITGTDANEIEQVSLTNFDSGSSQNEIQKIEISGLDSAVPPRNETQEIDVSGFGNGDEYYITFDGITSTLWLKNTGGSGNACPTGTTNCRAFNSGNLDEVIESVTGGGTITVNSSANNGFNVTFGGSRAATDVPRLGISSKADSGGALSATYDTGNSIDGRAAVPAESFSLTYGGETRSFTHSSNASIAAIDAFLEEKYTTDGTDDEFTVTENSANVAIDGTETSADFRIEFTGLLAGQPVSDTAIGVACSACTITISTVQDGQSGLTDVFSLTYSGGSAQTFTHGSNATAAAIDAWIENAEASDGDDFTVSGTTDSGPFLIRYDGFPGENIAGPRLAIPSGGCSGCTATVETVRDGALSSVLTTNDVVQAVNSGTGAVGNTTRATALFQVTVDLDAPTLNEFNEFKGDRFVTSQGGTAQVKLGSNDGQPGTTGMIQLDAYLLGAGDNSIDEDDVATFSFRPSQVTYSTTGQKNFVIEPYFPVPCDAPIGEYLVKSTFYDTKDAIGNTFLLGSTADIGILKVTPGDDLTTTTGFWGVNGDGTYSELVNGFSATKNNGNKRITTDPGVLHATTLLDATGSCSDTTPMLDFESETNEIQRVSLNGFQQTGGQSSPQPRLQVYVDLDGAGSGLPIEGGTVERGSTYTESGLEAAIAEILIEGQPLTVDIQDVRDNGFNIEYVGYFGSREIDFVLGTNRVDITVGQDNKNKDAVEVRKGGQETFDMTLEAPSGFRFEKTGKYFAKVVGGEWSPEETFSYTDTSLWGGNDLTSQLVGANGPTGNYVSGFGVFDPAYNRYDNSAGFESIAPPRSALVQVDLSDLDSDSTFVISVNNTPTALIDGEATAAQIEAAIEDVRSGASVRVSAEGTIPDRVITIDFDDGDNLVTSYYEGSDLEVSAIMSDGSEGDALTTTLSRGHGELLRIRLDGLGSEVPADWTIFARARLRYNGEASTGFAVPVECQSFNVRSSSHVDDYGPSDPAASLTDVSSYNFRYAPGSPAIGTSALPPAFVGEEYSAFLSGSNGTTWSILDDAELPPGLSLNPTTGEVSGEPTIDGLGLNVFEASLDGECGSTFKSVALTVIDLRVTSGPDLPSATEGAAYNVPLQAAGGSGGYVWDELSPPPAGLLLVDGVVQGVPTAPGTFTFKVRVTDSSLATATKTLSISVLAASP